MIRSRKMMTGIVGVIAMTSTLLASPATAAPSVTASSAPAVERSVQSGRTMREGDRGFDVGCVQRGMDLMAVITRGAVAPTSGVDGIFGQRTKWSVATFQNYMNGLPNRWPIPVNGVMDRVTGDALITSLFYNSNIPAVRDWMVYCQRAMPASGYIPF